jgi:hypothetical protein
MTTVCEASSTHGGGYSTRKGTDRDQAETTLNMSKRRIKIKKPLAKPQRDECFERVTRRNSKACREGKLSPLIDQKSANPDSRPNAPSIND